MRSNKRPQHDSIPKQQRSSLKGGRLSAAIQAGDHGDKDGRIRFLVIPSASSPELFGMHFSNTWRREIVSAEKPASRAQQQIDLVGRLRAVIQKKKSWEQVEKLLGKLEELP